LVGGGAVELAAARLGKGLRFIEFADPADVVVEQEMTYTGRMPRSLRRVEAALHV